MKKAPWLNKKISLRDLHKLKTLFGELKINTVCEEALCPNISECFSKGVATFMILGDICTRSCKFCAVKEGIPTCIDLDEPKKIKEAVRLLKLEYVVITSPARDDLEDGGAQIFACSILELKMLSFVKKIEVLIPDFLLNKKAIKLILETIPSVVAHNTETVPSLYKELRPQADYKRSLNALELVKEFNKNILTKSGIMLGLGEKDYEVKDVLDDLRRVGCDFLSIGQYLPPSLAHYPVKEYVHPEKFSYFEHLAYGLGFKHVMSSPYVRSSYMADTYLRSR